MSNTSSMSDFCVRSCALGKCSLRLITANTPHMEGFSGWIVETVKYFTTLETLLIVCPGCVVELKAVICNGTPIVWPAECSALESTGKCWIMQTYKQYSVFNGPVKNVTKISQIINILSDQFCHLRNWAMNNQCHSMSTTGNSNTVCHACWCDVTLYFCFSL